MGYETQTYAKLPVSPETYREISEKLRAAGYHHLFVNPRADDEIVVLSGIGIQKPPAEDPLDERGVRDLAEKLGGILECDVPGNLFRCHFFDKIPTAAGLRWFDGVTSVLIGSERGIGAHPVKTKSEALRLLAALGIDVRAAID
jgi:hypothetical protein